MSDSGGRYAGRVREVRTDRVVHTAISYNVKDPTYGAFGNDSADDTSAFLAAVNAAAAAGKSGLVYVPPGTYRVNLDLSAVHDLRLFGERGRSIIKPHNLADYALDVQDCNRIELGHLTFDGRFTDGATQATTLFEDFDTLKVFDCTFKNPWLRGLNVPARFSYPDSRNKYCEVAFCDFDATDRNGLYVGQCERTFIHHNLIRRAPDTGIDTGSYGGVIIITNNIILSAGTGIIVGEMNKNAIVAHNLVFGVTGNGITLYQETVDDAMAPEGFLIDGNVIEALNASSLSGISVKVRSGLIRGNRIKGFGSQVIRVQQPASPPTSGTAQDAMVKVEGNLIDTPAGNYGISVEATNVEVSGNTFVLGAAGLGGITTNKARTTIKGNTFYGGDWAIQLANGTTKADVSGNTIRASRSGISLASAIDSVVKDNDFFDSVFATNEIVESGSANTNTIQGNKLTANTSLTKVGAETVVARNDGHKTEARGVAPVANGGTIAHGLTATPTKYGATSTVAGHIATVTAVGSANITIGLTNHDGAAVTVAENVAWWSEV